MMSGREHAADYGVLFHCSTSVPGYQLAGNKNYPNIVKDYESSFARLRKLRCDVFLAAHGSFFNLTAKRGALQKGDNANPFIDPAGCKEYIDWSERGFRRVLEGKRGR
jgi:metallo-beta-lactamase class B